MTTILFIKQITSLDLITSLIFQTNSLCNLSDAFLGISGDG